MMLFEHAGRPARHAFGAAPRAVPVAVLSISLVVGGAAARPETPPVSFTAPVQDLATIAEVVMPPVDAARYLAEDAERIAAGIDGPTRFAAPLDVSLDPWNSGTWERLPNGSRLWRLIIRSDGAKTLNLGFTTYHMPLGASLHLYPADESARTAFVGPFTAADNIPEREFWSPIVPGDALVVELHVPASAAFEPEIVIGKVNHDYLGFGDFEAPASGACNNDVICPEGDPWRDETRSEAVYAISGFLTCSGQMVNSVTADPPPYFLTARHCGVNTGNDQTVRVYWNFESPTCGQHGGGSLSDNQLGSTWRASYTPSDFCLIELTSDPDPAFNVYYAGWDARESNAPTQCTAIHHPNTDEKSISFNYDPLTVTSYLGNAVPGDGTHWRVDDWEDGTTEPGSSGSAIWDQNHHIVGQLHGGYASCASITSDWYGRFPRSWTGGGTSTTRLQDWLDPNDTGTLVLEGTDPGAVAVQDAGATPKIAALAVSPNPSSGTVVFEFDLARRASVSFEVVDVAGRVLSRMPATVAAAGPHEIRWDGTGAAEARVAPGVYFVRMLVGERVVEARKLILLD
jgi:hypothetical protein